MCKRMGCLVLVLMLGLAGSVSAAEISWTNSFGDRDWCNANNWLNPSSDPCVPGVDDDAVIDGAPEAPIIGADCDANLYQIFGPDPGSGSKTMDITGGTLIVQHVWNLAEENDTGTATINISGSPVIKVLGYQYPWGTWQGLDHGRTILNISGDPNIYIESSMSAGDDPGSYVEINFDGGYLDCGALSYGDDGKSGKFTMSDGTIKSRGSFVMSGRSENAYFDFKMTGGSLLVEGDFVVPSAEIAGATLELDEGIIECGNFSSNSDAAWTMDIADGLLKIKGDETEKMQGYVDDGRITSYDGTSTPDVVWDGEYTLVGNGIPQEKAYSPQPKDGTSGICPESVTLTWSPGIFAVDHNVYFGASLDDVNGSEDPCTTLYGPDSNSWTVPYTLQLNKTYYWRIDEVNDPCIWEGSIWSFKTENGQAKDPSPVDGYKRASPNLILSWTPSCVADQQKLYLGTSEPLPSTPEATLSGADNNYSPTLDSFEHYYWRVDTIIGSDTITGQSWDFTTGVGGLIMYYKFDGSGSFPDPIYPDESYDTIAFEQDVGSGGSMGWGESNPMIEASTASADFDPCVGLKQVTGTGEDPLRLDGSQYTIEFWLKPENLDSSLDVTEDDWMDEAYDLWLIGKFGSYVTYWR